LDRLTNFRNGAGPLDKIILVFGTEKSLTDEEQRALFDLRAMGRARLGPLFDVETISIETIYLRLQEEDASSTKLCETRYHGRVSQRICERSLGR
jgi:hypothetical protein